MSVEFEKSPWRVEVKADYLSKVSSCNPERALAELIWNSLDADAHEVEVLFVDGPLGTVTEVIVRDDGEGFKADEAKQLFTSLGGSWKAIKIKSTEGRFLHGKEGQGRFKAFALGRSIEWKVTYKQAGELSTFVIDGLSGPCKVFCVTEF